MDAMKNTSRIANNNRACGGKGKGFSLIEVMIAMLVMMVGLLSLLALFSFAVTSMTFSKESMIAKQKAREALESVYTARNTQEITWDQVANVAPSSDGIFLNDFQPLYGPGTDSSVGPIGLVGTANYGAMETMAVSPGADGVPGTSDDVTIPLTDFQRRITITGISSSDAMRLIAVTIRYYGRGGITRDYTVTSIISKYR